MAGRNGPCMLWSSIIRGDTMLVEARCCKSDYERDEDQQQLPRRHDHQRLSSFVGETARLLLSKKPTPGWEHASLHRGGSLRNGGVGQNNTPIKLKGTKFHVYEHYGEDDSLDHHHHDEGRDNTKVSASSLFTKEQKKGLTIWTFACVYDPALVDEHQAKAFLEKIVTMTETFRQSSTVDDVVNDYSLGTRLEHTEEEDPWRYGSTYAVQRSFSPVLAQQMEQVSYLGKLALCHEQLDAAKSVMARNIELILEQDERLEKVIGRKAQECNEMALAFKKKSKQVKRQMLWNNAKHGLILGTAITAGVATVAVPTLIAIF